MTTTNFVKVGRIEDFQEGVIRACALDEAQVAVVSWRGGLYAFQNSCTHQGNPWTRAASSARRTRSSAPGTSPASTSKPGQLTDGPAFSGLSMYDVRVEDGDVLVSKEPRPE